MVPWSLSYPPENAEKMVEAGYLDGRGTGSPILPPAPRTTAPTAMPLFTIIIACLKRRRSVAAGIPSVRGQSCADWELIVIDGNSKDGSVPSLSTLDDNRITWRSEPDAGITDAWNKAIAMSAGRWLLFLGADDYLWDSSMLSRVAPHLGQTQAAFAYGDVAMMDDDAAHAVVRWPVRHLFRCHQSGHGIGLPHQGYFHHRERAFIGGLFDTQFKLAADCELVARQTSESSFLQLPVGIVTAFTMGGASTGVWGPLRIYREFQMIQVKHGRPVPWIPLGIRVETYARIAMRHVLGDRPMLSVVNASRRLRALPVLRRKVPK